MQIGDAVRFRAASLHSNILGPVGQQTGIVVDVAVLDGIETLSVVFGDNLLLETDVSVSELELVSSSARVGTFLDRLDSANGFNSHSTSLAMVLPIDLGRVPRPSSPPPHRYDPTRDLL